MLSRGQDIVHAIDVPQIVGWQKISLECYDGLIGNAVESSRLGWLHQREENNESGALSPTL